MELILRKIDTIDELISKYKACINKKVKIYISIPFLIKIIGVYTLIYSISI